MAATATPQNVMRIRRDQPSRLEGFVDASFAFAVTLLVISIGHVPESVQEMLQALRGVPTFAVCFALVARIWRSHRDWSRHYDLEDSRSVTLSLVLVFLVLIYVYPLRLLFSLMFAGVSDGLLAERTVQSISTRELRAAYIVFSLGYTLIWLVFAVLYQHAFRLRETIGLDAAERIATRFRVNLNISFCLIGILSIALAATLPFGHAPWLAALPGMAYLLMSPVKSWWQRRAIRDLAVLKARPA